MEQGMRLVSGGACGGRSVCVGGGGGGKGGELMSYIQLTAKIASRRHKMRRSVCVWGGWGGGEREPRWESQKGRERQR